LFYCTRKKNKERENNTERKLKPPLPADTYLYLIISSTCVTTR
jgi:hypothetical protein